MSAHTLAADFDAVVLAGGAEQPRDLPVPGRAIGGVHFAMDSLRVQNQRVAGDVVTSDYSAAGKHVVVIGGGDTGSDCVGTAHRHGARSVTQFELLPQPPEQEVRPLTWPYWPLKLRTSSSHEEGGRRDWSVATTAFVGDQVVSRLDATRVEWVRDGQWRMTEVPDSAFSIPADLVLLAMGFTGPVKDGLLQQLAVALDARGNVHAATGGPLVYHTSVARVFAAGDARRGQSLVVWAIREGRQCARAVDEHLMGASALPH